MKLKINGFSNELEFEENKVSVLVIKDTKCFTNIIQKLNDRIEGTDFDDIFLLDNNNEELKIQKEMCMITDLFNIDFNSKKILNKLYDIISSNIEKMEDIKIKDTMVSLRNYIIQEINELPFEFIMKDEPEITEILKIYNLKIDILNYKKVIEKVEFLIDILATLKISNILIIPNLKMYLDDEELVELYKYFYYNLIDNNYQ